MRHIRTAREFVDRVALGEEFGAEDLTVALVLAEAVDALKADPRSGGQLTISPLTDEQKAIALGLALALVVAHEIDQDLREGVRS